MRGARGAEERASWALLPGKPGARGHGGRIRAAPAATVEKRMGWEAQNRPRGLGRRCSARAALPGAAGGGAASAGELNKHLARYD